MNEQEIRTLLREMRDEPVPVDSLVRVRLRVDDGIRRRGRWRIGAWAVACASVLLAAVFAWHGMPVREVAEGGPEALPIVRSERPQPEESPLTIVPPSVRPAIRRRPRHVVREPQSVVIRMETADPDVVILLVSE
jgi:hypothetical protein